jgi:hypothetical protein
VHIDTPLGPVTFAVRAGAAEVDLTVGPAEAVLPDGYPPVTLWTATWRFAGNQVVSGFEIVAGLTATAPGIGGWPDSGYRLDALLFDNTDAVVSLGGPNEERLLEDFGLRSSVTYFDDLKLGWRLSEFESSGAAQLTLAVGWSEPTELPATWWAVDLP